MHFQEIPSQEVQAIIQRVQVVQTQVLATFSSWWQSHNHFGILAAGQKIISFEIQPETGGKNKFLLGLVAKQIGMN